MTPKEVELALIAVFLFGCALGFYVGHHHGMFWSRFKPTCRHDRIRGIYGDGINAADGMRSECLDCPATFPTLPSPRTTEPPHAR